MEHDLSKDEYLKIPERALSLLHKFWVSDEALEAFDIDEDERLGMSTLLNGILIPKLNTEVLFDMIEYLCRVSWGIADKRSSMRSYIGYVGHDYKHAEVNFVGPTRRDVLRQILEYVLQNPEKHRGIRDLEKLVAFEV